jgi:ribosomal protein S27AE
MKYKRYIRVISDSGNLVSSGKMLATGQAIRCPRCGAVSVHPKDIEEGYCARCHDWTGATDG